MGREEKRINVSELLRELNQRPGARCEGYKLGLDCTAKLTGALEPLIHHLNGDPRNNKMSNLALLCPKCHSSVMERLSETRRKIYAKKVAESLDKASFYRKSPIHLTYIFAEKEGSLRETPMSVQDSNPRAPPQRAGDSYSA